MTTHSEVVLVVYHRTPVVSYLISSLDSTYLQFRALEASDNWQTRDVQIGSVANLRFLTAA